MRGLEEGPQGVCDKQKGICPGNIPKSRRQCIWLRPSKYILYLGEFGEIPELPAPNREILEYMFVDHSDVMRVVENKMVGHRTRRLRLAPTRVDHNSIVYQYMSCTHCRCIVPAHYTHSVIQCRPIRGPGLRSPLPLGSSKCRRAPACTTPSTRQGSTTRLS